MSNSLNKVMLIGNIGNDPEFRSTPSGRSVLKFRVATNESWKDKSGQLQEHTEWHNVNIWGPRAEALQRIKPGTPGAIALPNAATVAPTKEAITAAKDAAAKPRSLTSIAAAFNSLTGRRASARVTTNAPKRIHDDPELAALFRRVGLLAGISGVAIGRHYSAGLMPFAWDGLINESLQQAGQHIDALVAATYATCQARINVFELFPKVRVPLIQSTLADLLTKGTGGGLERELGGKVTIIERGLAPNLLPGAFIAWADATQAVLPSFEGAWQTPVTMPLALWTCEYNIDPGPLFKPLNDEIAAVIATSVPRSQHNRVEGTFTIGELIPHIVTATLAAADLRGYKLGFDFERHQAMIYGNR